jgi:RimJ/RimL family protein N-acetyltransferase
VTLPDCIETERLLLRNWRAADRDPLAELLADPLYNRFMPGPSRRSAADALFGRIQQQIEVDGFGPWVLELPDEAEFIGFLGLGIPRHTLPASPCVEIGWHLVPSFWDQGYATEGATAALQFGFEQLGLDEIVSFTVPENAASIRVMEKIGMTRDVDGDFDHPALEEGHPLRPHILYRIQHN